MSGPRAVRSEARVAVVLIAPALLVVLGIALVPILATVWEALHQHDLRLPWLGRPFIGLSNFSEAFTDERAVAATLRSFVFTGISVPLELTIGLSLALIMHHAARARGLVRVATLLPFTIPTVVAALMWRFMFEPGPGNATDWFGHPIVAWVPIVLADVWKTTPFVVLLLLAGLQTIDQELYDAARMDGARPARQLMTITLPLLAPSLVVAATFRMLDALRLFDLPYVMTGGGPGTATEPLSLYAFTALMQRLRFGYGSTLSVLVFAFALLVSLFAVRILGRVSQGQQR